jgi:hypothetical protein
MQLLRSIAAPSFPNYTRIVSALGCHWLLDGPHSPYSIYPLQQSILFQNSRNKTFNHAHLQSNCG